MVTTSNYPPPKKSAGPIVAGIITAVVAVVCGAGVIVAALSGDPSGDPAGRSIATPKTIPAPAAGGGVPDEGVRPEPEPLGAKDFKPSIKILSKDCIDFQAMPDQCTYTYEVRLSIADVAAYKAAGDSYSVSYAVKGFKGGEQLDTVEVDGEGQFSSFPGFGTAGPKTKLTVRITEVERRP